MINYAEMSIENGMSFIHCLDVLEDVKRDISGVAQMICCMASAARHGAVLEPEQVELMADILLVAAEALDSIHISLEEQRAEGGGDDD